MFAWIVAAVFAVVSVGLAVVLWHPWQRTKPSYQARQAKKKADKLYAEVCSLDQVVHYTKEAEKLEEEKRTLERQTRRQRAATPTLPPTPPPTP